MSRQILFLILVLFSPCAKAQLLGEDEPVLSDPMLMDEVDQPQSETKPSNSSEATSLTSRYGEPVVFPFRIGAIVKARNGACREIKAMVAMPLECPEQSLKITNTEVTPQVEPLDERELQGGAARQLLISIPYLEANEEARVVITYEVTTRPTLDLPPELADSLVIAKRVPRELRRFIGPSPFIESKNSKIKKIVRQVDADLEAEYGEEEFSDWQRVEAYYDYVLDHIQYSEMEDTSALKTLNSEIADCHGRSALFVAICRAAEIPARMVWVYKHCYAEFYMQDPEGNGYWFPVESAGTRAFGAMPLVREVPLQRAIMQKGDNFRVPERPRERLRYATDYLIGKPMPGSGKPSVKYLREVVREGQE